MSDDFTARDAIAHTFAAWSSSEAEIDAVDYEVADDVLVRLAAAGWELHRAGEVVPTSDVLNLAQQMATAPWSKCYAFEYAEELRALTQQEPR